MHVVVVGGGPAGTTAAETLAVCGVQTTLVEKDCDRPKTCGGGLTPPVLKEFNLPLTIVERVVSTVRLFAPSGRFVDMSLGDAPIHLVRRERLDSYLRRRAQEAGAHLIRGVCTEVRRNGRGRPMDLLIRGDSSTSTLHADIVVGADGARSVVGQALGLARGPWISACQERIETPRSRFQAPIEIYFRADISPDLYGWVFPKGDHLCVGTASWTGRRRLPELLQRLKGAAGLAQGRVLRREAGVLPRAIRSPMVSGRILLVGDAAGLVSPLSGEGIYYAMKSGRLAGHTIVHAIASGEIPDGLGAYQATCRRLFRRLTRGLSLAQRMFYCDDLRREGFVSLSLRPAVRDTVIRYLEKAVSPWVTWGDLKVIGQNLLTFFCW